MVTTITVLIFATMITSIVLGAVSALMFIFSTDELSDGVDDMANPCFETGLSNTSSEKINEIITTVTNEPKPSFKPSFSIKRTFHISKRDIA